jgi:hypothetical protein
MTAHGRWKTVATPEVSTRAAICAAPSKRPLRPSRVLPGCCHRLPAGPACRPMPDLTRMRHSAVSSSRSAAGFLACPRSGAAGERDMRRRRTAPTSARSQQLRGRSTFDRSAINQVRLADLRSCPIAARRQERRSRRSATISPTAHSRSQHQRGCPFRSTRNMTIAAADRRGGIPAM